ERQGQCGLPRAAIAWEDNPSAIERNRGSMQVVKPPPLQQLHQGQQEQPMREQPKILIPRPNYREKHPAAIRVTKGPNTLVVVQREHTGKCLTARRLAAREPRLLPWTWCRPLNQTRTTAKARKSYGLVVAPG